MTSEQGLSPCRCYQDTTYPVRPDFLSPIAVISWKSLVCLLLLAIKLGILAVLDGYAAAVNTHEACA